MKMSEFDYAQCFLFVVKKNEVPLRSVVGYVLLPPPVIRDCQDILDCFARNGVNVLSKDRDFPELSSAVRSGKYELLEFLIKGTGMTEPTMTLPPNRNSEPPRLTVSAEKGYKKLLKNLIPTELCFFIGLPLHNQENLLRISHGGLDSVETLKQILADNVVNFRTDKGSTLLHLAVDGKNNIAFVRVCLQLKDTDIDAKDESGLTALHIAVKCGARNVVKLLLSQGANVNIPTNCGYTALQIAGKYLRSDICEILLNFGARAENLTSVTPRKTNLYTMEIIINFDHCSFVEARKNCQLIFLDGPEYLIIFNHIRLIALGLEPNSFSEVFKHRQLEMDALRNYLKLCEKEVGQLKEETVGDTNVTLYDVVVKGAYRISCYSRDEEFVRAMQSRVSESQFPIYSDVIGVQFRKALFRRQFLERGMKAVSLLVEDFSRLPYYTQEKIVNYLKNDEIIKISL